MPDISMCQDHSCPNRETCYRYTAEPNPHRQSYFAGSPRKGDCCEYHMPSKRRAALLLPIVLVAASFLFGCSSDPDCLFNLGPYCIGETGDAEPEEFYYDQDGIALLLDPDGDRAQSLIDEGRFVPHGIAPCEDVRKTWVQFTEFKSDGEIDMACCGDRGCDWGSGVTTQLDWICYPDSIAWNLDGLIGAVAPLDQNGMPRCDLLDPLGGVHEYLYAVHCELGVACDEHREQCGCRCGWDSLPCWQLDNDLETNYFGEDALYDAGWESWCTERPYWWNSQAYGTGGWVGGSCAFNQAEPSAPISPSVIAELMRSSSYDQATHTLRVSSKALELIESHPGVFDGSWLDVSADRVQIVECNELCEHLGGYRGLEVLSVGLLGEGVSVSDMLAARSELENEGVTEIQTRGGSVVTITIIVEE